jgi:hypothetical protein
MMDGNGIGVAVGLAVAVGGGAVGAVGLARSDGLGVDAGLVPAPDGSPGGSPTAQAVRARQRARRPRACRIGPLMALGGAIGAVASLTH